MFFVDDAGPSHIKPDIEIDISEPPSETENEPSVHDSEDEQQGDNSSEDSEATGDERPPISFKSQKAPAWADPDDVDVQVSLGTSNRLRKLREAPDDDTVGGREYERRLRRQYEAINPTPEWARKARKGLRSTKQKRRRSSASSEDDSVNEEEDSEYPGLLASTGGVLSQTKARALPQGTLSIERLRDANISARSEGAVKTVQFHPSLPVLLATGEDRRLRLFNVSETRESYILSNLTEYSSRLTVTQIPSYKPYTFLRSLLAPLTFTQAAHISCWQVHGLSTTLMTSSLGLHKSHLGVYGAPHSQDQQSKKVVLKIALSIPLARYLLWLEREDMFTWLIGNLEPGKLWGVSK